MASSFYHKVTKEIIDITNLVPNADYVIASKRTKDKRPLVIEGGTLYRDYMPIPDDWDTDVFCSDEYDFPEIRKELTKPKCICGAEKVGCNHGFDCPCWEEMK